MNYPSDDQFEDGAIATVVATDSGWNITKADGWSLSIPKYDGEPKAGSTIRVYGKGIGFRFRGVFIDGVKVFYRTTAEDGEQAEIESYGADAADWLKRWDEGRSVWSIEMGGLGPGYEQCIQIVAAEVVRFLLAEQPHAQDLIDNWKDKWSGAIDKALFANDGINALGLSGAQAGAGKNLGSRLYMEGPRKIMNTPEIKDRHIQVRRVFPHIGAVA